MHGIPEEDQNTVWNLIDAWANAGPLLSTTSGKRISSIWKLLHSQRKQMRSLPLMKLHYCRTVISVPACVVKPLYVAIVGWSPLAREGGTTTLN
jgi:hypothetical protein